MWGYNTCYFISLWQISHKWHKKPRYHDAVSYALENPMQRIRSPTSKLRAIRKFDSGHGHLRNWEHNSWVCHLGWASLSNISTKNRFEKERYRNSPGRHMLFHFNIQFPTQIGKKGSVPWCCKLHASHRSRRKHPQRYNEPNSLVTSTTSCTNLLHTRTIQCKECVVRSLRPRLLRLTSKNHCRIDMQTEQWSSLWTYQFPHRLPHQTNQAPHVLARIH